MLPDRCALDAAYRATSFFVDGPAGRFAIRVGRPSAEADDLLDRHGASAWAYVTAYNPGSVPTPAAANAARQRELEQTVAEYGYPYCRGEGAGDDGAWLPEPSLLVLGASEVEAVALARRFGQRAVVCGERGGPARLVWADAGA
jgi:hypothetical protein